jgi:type II secretory pathway pseudopilin PulG
VTAPHLPAQLCRHRIEAPAPSACERVERSFACRFVFGLLSAIALLLLASAGGAVAETQSVTKEQMQSLDEQIQEIKSDALDIAAELSGLEEKLLYPSNTQVAVFVSLSERENFRLDSVQIQIDGERVAHYIYSFKELEALEKGGVQRIYTGNISTGEHQLDVSIAGKSSGGKELEASESFSFRKDVEPKLVAITLAGQEFGEPRIELGGW